MLCCAGDILFDLKGRGDQKLGTSKNIDSNRTKMADWRFGSSIALAMIGDALVGLGFYSIGMQIAETHPIIGYLTIGSGYFGSIAGVFIHAFLCIQALVYKDALMHGDLQNANRLRHASCYNDRGHFEGTIRALRTLKLTKHLKSYDK